MSKEQQKYASNGGAVWAGIRDLNDKGDLPYDELKKNDRLDGRTVLITGATSGLGLATARNMAARGARLLIVSRRDAPAEMESIVSKCHGGTASATLLRADMTDFSSIRVLVDKLKASGEQIDVIVSNAAVVPSSARLTSDGYEEMLQVNALSPALLILELLKAGILPNDTYAGNGLSSIPGARLPRIIIVASEAHRSAEGLELETLENIEPYGMAESTPRYGWTKLLLLTFARELGRRLLIQGKPDVSVHALCPGPIASNIAREAPAIAQPFAWLFFRIFFQSPELAARPVVYLSASDRIEGQSGLYQFLMRTRKPSAVADAPVSGSEVWDAFQSVFNESVARRA